MKYNIYNTKISSDMAYSTPNAKNKEKTKMTQDDTLIKKIAGDISEFNDLREALGYFTNLSKENTLFKQISTTSFQYKDFFVDIGKNFILAPHAMGLKNTRAFNLTCAPKLIAYSDLKNQKDCVLVTKIPNSENNTPVPYRNIANEVNTEAKKKFLDDVQNLADGNLVNTCISNIENWYVVPGNQNIVISNWSDFTSFRSPEEKNSYIKQIGEKLGFIY